MKNLLMISLFLVSVLPLSAQATQKKWILASSDYDSYAMQKRNINAVYFTDSIFMSDSFDSLYNERSYVEPAESIIIDSATFESNDHALTTESVALHITVLSFQEQSPMNSDVDIFYNSDFIKGDSGTTESDYGKFDTHLMDFGWYNILVTAPGYFDATDTVWVTNLSRKTINKQFFMVPIAVGMKVAMTGVNFDFDKTGLSAQTFIELDKQVLFLNKNPNIVFEISGHTDNQGSKDYNIVLSEARAQTVVNYLVGKGAERSQLIVRGYGEAKPMSGNETILGRANNRRVEFKVLTTGADYSMNDSIVRHRSRHVPF